MMKNLLIIALLLVCPFIMNAQQTVKLPIGTELVPDKKTDAFRIVTSNEGAIGCMDIRCAHLWTKRVTVKRDDRNGEYMESTYYFPAYAKNQVLTAFLEMQKLGLR